MKAAGDCPITPHSQVTAENFGSKTWPCGIIMDLGTPFDAQTVSPEERAKVKDELIELLMRLHNERGIIHGYIKPDNILRCRDGKLRFCDFGMSRWIPNQRVEGLDRLIKGYTSNIATRSTDIIKDADFEDAGVEDARTTNNKKRKSQEVKTKDTKHHKKRKAP